MMLSRRAVAGRCVARQARTQYDGPSKAGFMVSHAPQHMQHWLESNAGNHFRNWDRMGPEDVDIAYRAKSQGTWYQNLKWGDYIVVKRAKATEEMCDHGIYMGWGRGICTYTRYRDPAARGTLWLGRNLMIWLEPDLFALEDDDIYVNDMLVYSPDPDRQLGDPLVE